MKWIAPVLALLWTAATFTVCTDGLKRMDPNAAGTPLAMLFWLGFYLVVWVAGLGAVALIQRIFGDRSDE